MFKRCVVALPLHCFVLYILTKQDATAPFYFCYGLYLLKYININYTGWFWNNATFLYHRDQREKLSLDHLVPKVFQEVFRTCFRRQEIYSVAPALEPTADHRAAAAAAKSGGTLLLRSLLTVAGRGKAGEAREDCQTVDDRLSRKTFIRSTNFSWLAYCWWNNEMLHNTDFTDALVDINQALRYTRVIINFFISRKTADGNFLQHYVKTWFFHSANELMWSVMYHFSKRKCTEKNN